MDIYTQLSKFKIAVIPAIGKPFIIRLNLNEIGNFGYFLFNRIPAWRCHRVAAECLHIDSSFAELQASFDVIRDTHEWHARGLML